MNKNSLIQEKLFGRYENFFKYCEESGKKFIGELDREDFIAYRAEYSVPREQVEQLKSFIGFREHKSVKRIFPSQSPSADADSQRANVSAKTLPFARKGFDELAVRSLFRDLPDELRNKRARPFLIACGLEDDIFVAALSDNLTLAELPEYLVNNSLVPDLNKLKRFVDTLHFDVRDCAKKIVVALFKDKREFDIVRRRIKGSSFDELEKIFGVTPEVVRQIESRAINRFMQHRADVKKIFYFLRALTNGKSFLSLDDMKTFIDGIDAEVLRFFVAKKKLQSKVIPFDEGLGSFMDRRRGKMFRHGNRALTLKCAYVLKKRFPNGYKIDDENFYLRFTRHIQEIFGKDIELKQKVLDTQIKKIGVLCDRKKYIHPDRVHIPPAVMEQVKNFIDASDCNVISYKDIFKALKDLFVGTQITNPYFLHGIIKSHKLPYTLHESYLIKSNGIDIGQEFDKFVSERGEVTRREIKENFPSLTDANIDDLLLRCPEVFRAGCGTFMHAKRLNLREDDFEPIKNFLRRNCSTPVSSRVLCDLFLERFAKFMIRNDIQNHGKLFGVLQYMFRDEFSFSRSYISTTNIKNISNKAFLLGRLESLDEIAIEDLRGICEEYGIHCASRNFLIDSLRPDFIRVDEFILRRPESIGVTDEILFEVAENIRGAVERNGGWQAAHTFADYEWLPRLEAPWNSFLLESAVALAANAPCSLKMPSSSANWSTTVFLSEEFAGCNFQSFLIKVLSSEHKKEPFQSESEILNWLKAQGLCNGKLPKFLADGKVFKLLGEERVGDLNVCLRMGQRYGRL